MAKKKKRINQLLIEFLSIVFAVTLALTLNEWRQNQKTRVLVDRILQTLRDETDQNLKSVTASIEYREKLVNELRSNTYVIASFPVNEVPFNIDNDRQIENFFKQSILENFSEFPEKIEVIRIGSKRYLRIDKSLNTLTVDNDTLTIYGKSNIQLKTAGVTSNSWDLAQATNAFVEMDYNLVKVMGQMNKTHQDYIKTAEKAINILYTGEGGILPVLEDMLELEKELKASYDQIIDMTK